MVISKLDGTLLSRLRTLQELARRAEETAGPAAAQAAEQPLPLGDAAVEAARIAAEAVQAAGQEQVRVLAHIEGDLAAAESAGLWTEFRTARVAVGRIAVADLENVAAVTDVIAIHGDQPVRPLRPDQAAPAHPDAEAVTASGTPVADIADTHAEAMPPLPDGVTGKGTLVGVIDSGIDIYHPAFIKPGSSPPRTRIVSLLDFTLRQTIECTGNPTGSVVLTWLAPGAQASDITPSLAFPLQAATVQAALEAFNSIDPGDVKVTGGPLPGTPVVVDFTGHYDGKIVEEIGLRPSFTGGTSPKIAVRRGRVITEAEINAALQASPRVPFVSRDGTDHGTHVAGIAAGVGKASQACCKRDQPIGVAPDADLAIVRALTKGDIVAGATHVFGQSWLAPGVFKKPAVVNVSLGSFGSAGDGSDPTDLALDDLLVGSNARSIVVAAGNEGDSYPMPSPTNTTFTVPTYQRGGGQHARGFVPAHGTTVLKPLRFFVEFADNRPDWFDLWYEGPGELAVDLYGPPSAPGAVSATVGPHLHPQLTPSPNPKNTQVDLGGTGGHPLTYTYYSAVPPSGKRHLRLTISPPAGQDITMGSWEIELRETAGFDTWFDVWFLEDRTDPSGRFDTANQDRSRTVTSPGTARQVITVGSFNPEDDRLAPYSSRGPTTDSRLKPELCAPGEQITSAKNGGTPPDGLYAVDSGTSMASPYVAGVVALMFEVNGILDQGAIVSHLISTCDDPVPPVPPGRLDSGWGKGRVNPEKAVNAVRAASAARRTVTPHTPDEPLVLPAAAYPAARVPFTTRVRQVRSRIESTPAGRHLASLAATHQPEVQRLVTGDRRVTVAWHRMHGPLLVRLLLFSELYPDAPVPRTLGGKSVADGLARLLEELHRAGSPALRAGITAHRAFVLALPGARLSELDVPTGEVS